MIGLGLRAQKGGAVAVGLRIEAGEPQLMFSRIIPTGVEDDPLSFEPYRTAAALPREQAAAAVTEGRERQDRLAAESLRSMTPVPSLAALLVNRAGWITDLLDYSLAWPEHVPVAELLAVREALRAGCRMAGIEIAELDEKSLPDQAAAALGLTSAQIEERLKNFGAAAGKPWRKEQKLACLAAWVGAVTYRS